MKKLLILLFAFVGGISMAHAQWLDKSGTQFGNSLMWNVQVLDANNVWAINYDNGEVVKTTNGGQTWMALPVTDPTFAGYFVEAIHVLNPTTAWLTASISSATQSIKSRIYKTTDGGLTWQHQTSAFANPGTGGSWSIAMHFFNANDGITLSEKQVPNPGRPGYYSIIEILTTSNGGTTWQEVQPANMPPQTAGLGVYYRAYAAVGNTLWFMTTNSHIYKTTDKGLTWTETNPGFSSVSQIRASIAFSDANNGIVTNGGPLKRTTDGGATWTTLNTVGSWFTDEIAFVPGTTGTFISGGRDAATSGSSISYDHGNTWSILEVTNRHADIHFINPTTGWSAGYGKMLQFNGTALGTGKDITEENSFTIYPNPSKSTFQIKPATEKPFKLEVYDVVGNRLKQQNGNSFGQNLVDLSAYKKGIYLLHIINGDKRIIEKLILQ